MTRDGVDELDQAVIHALQVDGRAPFRRIGEVLGVSDQTVARRFGRLSDVLGLRVLALADPVVLCERQWVLRVRAAPEAATEVAEALARRADTSWISLCSGGTEIVASAGGDGVESLLFEALPRTRHILDVRAHEVLHVFYGGAGQPFTKRGPLTESQTARLARHVPAGVGPPPRMDRISRRMLEVLRADGRAPLDELTAATGASAGTVRRRLRELRASGVLHFDVDVGLTAFDVPVRTLLWLTVGIDALPAAGAALAARPEVAFAAGVTGSGNLFASVSTRDTPAVAVPDVGGGSAARRAGRRNGAGPAPGEGRRGPLSPSVGAARQVSARRPRAVTATWPQPAGPVSG
ncbi:Lrp/AsnC family transcriptional regulator [Streptomyces malaysiensis]|uniref:Lrp/AsnC family transcriptional regulator n=1 Tax=Streptomyces malaysiensis TaxID=92644 RepID=UPI00202E0841|nr:AsnC family transcriptional regulator [Streptomyces malaysiensis]